MGVIKSSVCMRVWGGAEIPPEPQLTPTQKNSIAAWQAHRAWIQRWHIFTGFSTSILPKYRPLARSQEGNWNSIIPFTEQHIRDTCQSSVSSTAAPRNLSLSRTAFYSEMIGKHACWALYIMVGAMKTPAHTHIHRPNLQSALFYLYTL